MSSTYKDPLISQAEARTQLSFEDQEDLLGSFSAAAVGLFFERCENPASSLVTRCIEKSPVMTVRRLRERPDIALSLEQETLLLEQPYQIAFPYFDKLRYDASFRSAHTQIIKAILESQDGAHQQGGMLGCRSAAAALIRSGRLFEEEEIELFEITKDNFYGFRVASELANHTRHQEVARLLSFVWDWTIGATLFQRGFKSGLGWAVQWFNRQDKRMLEVHLRAGGGCREVWESLGPTWTGSVEELIAASKALGPNN